MEVKEISIDQIKGSLCRMRLEKDYEKEEMLASIGECGVMDPIKLKKVKNGYLIFAGHRRLECAKELGKKTIGAEIWKNIPDSEAVLMGFVENINRKDFTLLEEGHAYQKLIKEYGHTVEGLVKPCGKSRTRIYLLLKLVQNLTGAMKKAIMDGKMTSGHAEWLLRIEDPERRERIFREIVEGKRKWDVEDLKYLVYRQKPDSEKDSKELQLDIIEDIFEEDPEIKKRWNKGITARRSRKGLKITLDVDGPHDLLLMCDVISEPLRRNLKKFEKFRDKL